MRLAKFRGDEVEREPRTARGRRGGRLSRPEPVSSWLRLVPCSTPRCLVWPLARILLSTDGSDHDREPVAAAVSVRECRRELLC
jgi:hypothetical protein